MDESGQAAGPKRGLKTAGAVTIGQCQRPTDAERTPIETCVGYSTSTGATASMPNNSKTSDSSTWMTASPLKVRNCPRTVP